MSTGVYREGGAHIGRPIHQLGGQQSASFEELLGFHRQDAKGAEDKQSIELGNSNLLVLHSVASLCLGGLEVGGFWVRNIFPR